jgi:hypothetical protein
LIFVYDFEPFREKKDLLDWFCKKLTLFFLLKRLLELALYDAFDCFEMLLDGELAFVILSAMVGS